MLGNTCSERVLSSGSAVAMRGVYRSAGFRWMVCVSKIQIIIKKWYRISTDGFLKKKIVFFF